ncbi:MAG: hypothetical protein COZ36_08150, partial [Piscirickettsiaceae bacterium CG_4_10_14_3_um_filter_44_349]
DHIQQLAEYRQRNCWKWLNPLLLISVINGGITQALGQLKRPLTNQRKLLQQGGSGTSTYYRLSPLEQIGLPASNRDHLDSDRDHLDSDRDHPRDQYLDVMQKIANLSERPPSVTG